MKEPAGNTGTEESPLTVSDWVTFLSNERQAHSSNFLSFSAVVVASIAILFGIFSTTNKTWSDIMGISLFSVLVLVVWVGLSKPFDKNSTRAKNILTKIMEGELTQEKDIRKSWKHRKLKN